ncbi:MAG TPA: hypothetical protein VGC79_17775 [Polyangiaceae bacterium]
MIPKLIKSFGAGGALGAYRIVKNGAADGTVLIAAAATDKLLGVTDRIATASGDVADIVLSGSGELVAGGNVAFGDPITSDAAGAGVVAAPAGGANVRIIGFALSSAVANDIFPIRVAPGFMQG